MWSSWPGPPQRGTPTHPTREKEAPSKGHVGTPGSTERTSYFPFKVPSFGSRILTQRLSKSNMWMLPPLSELRPIWRFLRFSHCWMGQSHHRIPVACDGPLWCHGWHLFSWSLAQGVAGFHTIGKLGAKHGTTVWCSKVIGTVWWLWDT